MSLTNTLTNTLTVCGNTYNLKTNMSKFDFFATTMYKYIRGFYYYPLSVELLSQYEQQPREFTFNAFTKTFKDFENWITDVINWTLPCNMIYNDIGITISTESGNKYTNIQCFDKQGKGSGASILSADNNILIKCLKLNDINLSILNDYELSYDYRSLNFNAMRMYNTHLHLFMSKLKFILEAWVNDYLKRQIYIHKNICDNYARVIECCTYHEPIHIQHNKSSTAGKLIKSIDLSCISQHEYNTLKPTYYGFIVMEKIDGTFDSFNQFTYGLFFEYLYAKLVAFVKCNILFADHYKNDNCGYRIVDYIRQYNLTYMDQTLTIYIQDKHMTTVFDFDNINICSIKYHDKKTKLYNFYYTIEDCFGCDNTYRYIIDNMIEHAEIQHLHDLNMRLKDAFNSDTQMQTFFDIIKQTIPSKYLIKPNTDTNIKIKNFKYSLDILSKIRKDILLETQKKLTTVKYNTSQLPSATQQLPSATQQLPVSTPQLPVSTPQLPLATQQLPVHILTILRFNFN